MYPTGGNGASQAILDARSLTDHLASGVPVADALAAYDAERLAIVRGYATLAGYAQSQVNRGR